MSQKQKNQQPAHESKVNNTATLAPQTAVAGPESALADLGAPPLASFGQLSGEATAQPMRQKTVMRMQKTHGNQYVQRFITKPKGKNGLQRKTEEGSETEKTEEPQTTDTATAVKEPSPPTDGGTPPTPNGATSVSEDKTQSEPVAGTDPNGKQADPNQKQTEDPSAKKDGGQPTTTKAPTTTQTPTPQPEGKPEQPQKEEAAPVKPTAVSGKTEPTAVTPSGAPQKGGPSLAGPQEAQVNPAEAMAQIKGKADGTMEGQKNAVMGQQAQAVAEQTKAGDALANAQTGLQAVTTAETDFAPAPEKPMFMANDEALSTLGIVDILGKTSNGLTLYQTDDASASARFAEEEEGFVQRRTDDQQHGPVVTHVGNDFAAQLRAQKQAEAKAILAGFMANGGGKIQELINFSATIEPRIRGTATQVKGAIDTAVTTNVTNLEQAISQSRGQVKQASDTAVAAINKKHTDTITAIGTATTTAQNKLKTQKETSLKDLTQLEKDTIVDLDKSFEQAAKDFNAAGTKVGGEATAKGTERRTQFEAEPLQEAGFFDGADYYVNRRKAKADAATQVAESYRKEAVDKAAAAAAELPKQRPDLVRQIGDKIKTARDDVTAKYDTTSQAIDTSNTNSLKAANDALPGHLNGVKAQVDAATGILDQLKGNVTKMRDLGTQQKTAVDTLATQSIATLKKQVADAIDSVREALDQIKGEAGGMEPPDPNNLKNGLGGVSGEIDKIVADTMKAVNQSVEETNTNLFRKQDTTVSGINKIGEPSTEKATATGTNVSGKINELKGTAVDAYTTISKNHDEKAKLADTTVSQMQKVVTDARTSFSTLRTTFGEKTKTSATELEGKLRDSLKNLDSDITSKANEAADKVQPAWKGWVKIFISIVITALVGLAIGALMASGVGLLGLIIGAMVIGAVGGLVEKGLHDLVDGKLSSPMDYLKAAGLGAVNGLISLAGAGAAGKLTDGLLKGSMKLIATEIAVDTVFNTTSNVVLDFLADGKMDDSFWKHLGMGFGGAIMGQAIKGAWSKVSGLFKGGGEPQIKTGGEPEIKTGGEPEVKTGGEPEVKLDNDVKTGGEPEVKTGGEPEVKTGGEPEVKTGGEPEVKTGGEPEVKTGGEPEVKTGGEPEVKTGGEPEVKTGGEPEVKTGGEPEMKTGEPEVKTGEPEVKTGEPEVKAPEVEGPKTGAQIAKDLGYPEPPPGYHWAKNGEGVILKRNPGQAGELPQLKYDPETKAFVPVDARSAGAKIAQDLGYPEPPPGYHWAKNGDGAILKQNPGSDLPQLKYDPATKEFSQVVTATNPLGKVQGEYDFANRGPLDTKAPQSVVESFAGQRYKEIELAADTILYRAGDSGPGKELGQFLSSKPPVSEVQVRIDQAVLPKWPGGGESPLNTVYKLLIPKGTKVYVGEIGVQGGFYMGGTEQIVVLKPWTIPGVQVLDQFPLVK